MTDQQQRPPGLPTGQRKRKRGKPAPHTLDLSVGVVPGGTLLASTLSPTGPKVWLLDGWEVRRERYMKRLGEWAALTMQRLQLSSRELEALAARTGGMASATTFRRLARQRMRDTDPVAAREHVNIGTVLWLATLAGQTLADIDRYLRSGDTGDLDPSIESRADTLRGAYLALTPTRQAALDEFARYLYQMDMAERQPIVLPTGVPAPTLTHIANTLGALDTPDVSDALHEIARARADLENAHTRVEAQEALEAQQEEQIGGKQSPDEHDERDQRDTP